MGPPVPLPYFGPVYTPPKPKRQIKPLKVKIAVAPGYNCSCVNYAKSLTGFNTPIGRAKNWPINSSIPVVGGVVVFKWLSTGHAAVVTDVTETDFGIKEAHYVGCSITIRRIPLNNPTIIGFWANKNTP